MSHLFIVNTVIRNGKKFLMTMLPTKNATKQDVSQIFLDHRFTESFSTGCFPRTDRIPRWDETGKLSIPSTIP